MSQFVTIELSEQAARQIQEVAARTHRSIEEILTDWIEHFVEDLPVEWLPDEDVMAQVYWRPSGDQDKEMNHLLAKQREHTLNKSDKIRLEELLTLYRKRQLRKTEAVLEAAKRGLIIPGSESDSETMPLPEPKRR